MVTVISRLRVRNGLDEEVRKAFLLRPRLAEKASGFCGFDILTDAADPAIFILITRWTDQASFQTWHRSDAHHQSHAFIPQGLKLDPSFTSLTIANSVEYPAEVQTLSDSLEGQTVAISKWLLQSDTVFALLLGPDGAIRARNPASDRIFPPDPDKNFGSKIWDYLLCSDAQQLCERLADPKRPDESCLRVNMVDPQQNQITLEIGLIPSRGTSLLLAVPEARDDVQFRNEISRLTNDLSVMVRDVTQKNRELKEAHATVERLARADELTGLANRRTLDEVLRRETARAERLGERLSVIMADLDHFKSINDQYGHLTGDRALTRAAAVLGSQLRPYDLAARYGGEEFVVLLPGTSTEAAVSVAERFRQEIEKTEVPGCAK